MADLFKNFFLGTVSSMAAAFLMIFLGVAGDRVRFARLRELKFIEPNDPPGSISSGLRRKNIALGFLLAGLITILYVTFPETTPRENPDFLLGRSDDIMRDANDHASSELSNAEDEAEEVLSKKTWGTNRGFGGVGTPVDQEDRERFLAHLSERANRIIKMNQDRIDRELKQAEGKSEELRKRAADLRRQPGQSFEVHRGAILLNTFVFGLLLIAFLRATREGNKFAIPGHSGFLAGGAIAMVIAGTAGAMGSFGALALFEPLLLSAALYTSCDASLSTGEVILNSLYTVYRRFGIAVIIVAVAALVTIASTGLIVGLIWLEKELVDAVLSPFLGDDAVSAAMLIGASFSLRIFSCLFGAISAAVFLSVLCGVPASGKLRPVLEAISPDSRRFPRVQALYKAFFSKSLYEAVAQRWCGLGLTYLLLLVTLCSIPWLLRLQFDISKFVTEKAPEWVEQIPPIRISQGRLSTPAKTPYFIKDPATDETVAIIDPAGDLNTFDKTDATVLLTASQLFIRTVSGVNGYELSRLAKATGLENSLIDQNRIDGWLRLVRHGLVLVIAPVLLLLTFVFTILQVLAFSAIGLVIVNAWRKRLTYETIVRLTAVSITPVLIVEAVQDLIGWHLPSWWIIYFFITLGYLVFAIWSSRRTPTNAALSESNQKELTGAQE